MYKNLVNFPGIISRHLSFFEINKTNTKLKILYISPENTVGTLSLWKKAHEARGNQCEFVTMYPSRFHDDNGICLHLPLIKSNPAYMQMRHNYYKLSRGSSGDYTEKKGYPPTWQPSSPLEKFYFRFRDWLWSNWIEPAIKKYNLLEFDIYHLEWGLDFYRDGRFAQKLAEMGKPLVCTYHGQDMRTRGVIPAIGKLSNLNLTGELDLLEKHPHIHYLFLPYDTSIDIPDYEVHSIPMVCHAPTNRFYKGSDDIIPVCEKLAAEKIINFTLVENATHEEVYRVKGNSDILIDQVGDRGGWGYGMNSVEALSLGKCCLTELTEKYVHFIPDHPFVNINADTLEIQLRELASKPELISEYKQKSREWVVKYHDMHNTAEKLYSYYKIAGIM